MSHYTEYRNQLQNAFPKVLQNDIDVVLNILPFDDYKINPSYGVSYNVDNLIDTDTYTVQRNNEVLEIPYRLYLNEPKQENEDKLSDTQKTILNCIYLHHYNGYIRQKRLENLINKSQYWVVPHTIQLLGEYVFELLQPLDKLINANTINNYVSFVKENTKYWQKTESRMVSYWNAYYRHKSPKLKDYLGKQISNRISAKSK